ncbi:phosphoribosylamine--glycine ligase [Salisediminibacterium selenitireducens]|uniref:Phosphoribosylamine--glycine ligase n=1 Tax=Bacillus selenitireducens (strain ATCC 700615 / DSM 15326 / MLS10) TaxID=439292 RepID=D6XYS6_BACIE|nr:phosphoribosylamine--glycine ligase [Salisediminibacterium selenitireducens]ADH98234.1 phosphoribosylamine/glycine ligase [[Bacillus] selenitireducens MLS10]
MNILVIGSGGREHTLAWKFAQSERVEQVYVAPGNDAIAEEPGCQSVPIQENDHEKLVAFARENRIGLTMVGPEAPLVDGVTDAFTEAGLTVFGPTKAAAALEGSKDFAKGIMQKYNIPTAAYATFTNPDAAMSYIREQGAPIVVKADGLAAGKGVVVAKTEEEAIEAVTAMMQDHRFGEAGSRVVIEECLEGEELSFMAFVHGTAVVPMVTAQDHKRAFDGDEGPNTGGMGAYSPVPHLDGTWQAEAERTILRPMAEAMVNEGVPFTGILYGGLMITADGPRVIEFNARFGDPETQVILPRMMSDLTDTIEAVLAGEEPDLVWTEEACAAVVIASEGYPGEYKKGTTFTLPVPVSDKQRWFHAGSKRHHEQWQTAGGRVAALSTLAPGIDEAVSRTYETLGQTPLDGLFYRRDIAHHVRKKS